MNIHPVDGEDERTGAEVDARGDEDQQGEEEAGEPIRCLPCPGAPSAADRLAHEIAHWPYRPWCEWCVRGRAVGPNSKKVPAANRESLIPKSHLDYAFLQDEIVEDNDDDEFKYAGVVSLSMTLLVMYESLCESIWTYAVNAKGFASDPWLPKKLHNDLTTVGMGHIRIVVKTDTEPAILDLRREMTKSRGEAPTGFEDSRVGDSNSNGKIERIIREVKGLIRTLRADLQDKIQSKITLDSPIVPWLVRHVGYIMTRCRVHPCGRTSMHRMKGQKTHRPMIPFGEAVLFKIPKTKRRIGDFEDRFEKGIWVGMTVQSGENIVATGDGVYRVGGIMRCAPDKRWSAELVGSITGTPAEPRPGSGSDTIPTYAKHQEERRAEPTYQQPPEAIAPKVRPAYIYKNDVAAHGATPGCKACSIALNRGNSTGYTHTTACRARFEDIFKNMNSEKLRRADDRMNEAVYNQSTGAEPPPAAEEEEDNHMADADGGIQAQEPPSTSSTSPVANSRRIVRDPVARAAMANANGSVRDRKRPANADEEDGSHAPGQATVQASQPTPTPTSPPTSTSTRPTPSTSTSGAASSSAAAGSSSSAAAGSSTATPSRDKRKASEGPEGEHANVYRCTDLLESPAVDTPIMQLAKNIVSESNIHVAKDETVGSREAMRHPGPVVHAEEITSKEKQWQNIGSGVFARTIVQAERMSTTSRGGPPIEDVHRRTIWSLSKGRIIDDCIVDDTADHILNRWLDEPDDIRIELTMKGALKMYNEFGPDVVEVYSQPRVTQAAAEFDKDGMKLSPGWSLDFTRADPQTGEAWDLSRPDVQSRVIKLVERTQPLFIIGSPPCTAFSPLQNLSKHKRDPSVVRAELDAGRIHLEFCAKLYDIQNKAGRFFVHEHPCNATSWAEECVAKIAAMDGVDVATVDMCTYGMRVNVGPVQGPARKRTRIMSNSKEVLKRIASLCPNSGEDKSLHHVHVPLDQGRAKRCQVYPREFSRRICDGIAAEKRLRQMGLVSLPLMDLSELGDEIVKGQDASSKLHEDGGMQAFDDQSGEHLVPELVKRARVEEMAYFRSMKVYEKVPITECLQATGRKPIAVRWVDVNKGDSARPNYRSRLVAKEFRGNDDRPEWFAATPPSECLKLMLHRLASNRGHKLLYADVSRAYFYAPAVRPVYVQLPDEDRTAQDVGMCGKLRVSMYGTRDAAMNWAKEYGETLKKAGFVQGKTSPCLFFHEGMDVAIMVHGDDFVAVGDPAHLAATEAALREKYKLKTETLGSDAADAKEVRILNKVVRMTEAGVELEADPRHAELIVRELGLEHCKPSKAPGSKATEGRYENRVIKPSNDKTISAIDSAESEGEMKPESENDVWTCSGDHNVWRREHATSRRALFTPTGTAGSPPRPARLRGKRVTEGTFDHDGKGFIIVDDWRDKRDAHRRLEGSWTGTTTFEEEPAIGSRTATDLSGSVGSRIPGTDEADGPAKEQDEHQMSGRAEPKPEQETVRVRRSAGKIVEIERADDGVSIDELNQTWELLAVDGDIEDENDPELVGSEATRYRSVTARLNYIGPDRVDLQYATKEAARHMAVPRESHLNGLCKIGKYIAGRPRLISHFKWQTPCTMITGFTDSDWAGCTVTARSTSGGIVSVGSHVIKTYSRQQKTIALSSAEAELHAMVAASAEVLGTIGLCRDLGMQMSGEILADSSAALGITNRAGSGKVRHLRIQALWVQEVKSTGRLGYKKVLGTLNPSDVLTKHVPGDLLDAHLRTLGMEVRGGRSDVAPTLDSVIVEYLCDWVEATKDEPKKKKKKFGLKVRFNEDVLCRNIPATGRQLPTGHARKTRCTWADTKDEECGIDSVVSGDDDEEYDDLGDFEIIENIHGKFDEYVSGIERQQSRVEVTRASVTGRSQPPGDGIIQDDVRKHFWDDPNSRISRESSLEDLIPRGSARRDRVTVTRRASTLWMPLLDTGRPAGRPSGRPSARAHSPRAAPRLRLCHTCLRLELKEIPPRAILPLRGSGARINDPN